MLNHESVMLKADVALTDRQFPRPNAIHNTIFLLLVFVDDESIVTLPLLRNWMAAAMA